MDDGLFPDRTVSDMEEIPGERGFDSRKRYRKTVAVGSEDFPVFGPVAFDGSGILVNQARSEQMRRVKGGIKMDERVKCVD